MNDLHTGKAHYSILTKGFKTTMKYAEIAQHLNSNEWNTPSLLQYSYNTIELYVATHMQKQMEACEDSLKRGIMPNCLIGCTERDLERLKLDKVIVSAHRGGNKNFAGLSNYLIQSQSRWECGFNNQSIPKETFKQEYQLTYINKKDK